jgi:hypothetical protein
MKRKKRATQACGFGDAHLGPLLNLRRHIMLPDASDRHDQR